MVTHLQIIAIVISLVVVLAGVGVVLYVYVFKSSLTENTESIGNIIIVDESRNVGKNEYEAGDTLKVTLSGDYDTSKILTWGFSQDNGTKFTSIPNTTTGNTITYTLGLDVFSEKCVIKASYPDDSHFTSSSTLFEVVPKFNEIAGLGFEANMKIFVEGATNFTVEFPKGIKLSSNVTNWILELSPDRETWTKAKNNITSINLTTGFVIWDVTFNDFPNRQISWRLSTLNLVENGNAAEMSCTSIYTFIIDSSDGSSTWIAKASDGHVYSHYQSGEAVDLVYRTAEEKISGAIIWEYSTLGIESQFLVASDAGTPVINARIATSSWTIPNNLWTNEFILQVTNATVIATSSNINISPIITWDTPKQGSVISVFPTDAPGQFYINTSISGTELSSITKYQVGWSKTADAASPVFFASEMISNTTVRWTASMSNIGLSSLGSSIPGYFIIQISNAAGEDTLFVTGNTVTFKAVEFSLVTKELQILCDSTDTACSPGTNVTTTIVKSNTIITGAPYDMICAGSGKKSICISPNAWTLAIFETASLDIKLYQYQTIYVNPANNYGGFTSKNWMILGSTSALDKSLTGAVLVLPENAAEAKYTIFQIEEQPYPKDKPTETQIIFIRQSDKMCMSNSGVGQNIGYLSITTDVTFCESIDNPIFLE